MLDFLFLFQLPAFLSQVKEALGLPAAPVSAPAIPVGPVAPSIPVAASGVSRAHAPSFIHCYSFSYRHIAISSIKLSFMVRRFITTVEN